VYTDRRRLVTEYTRARCDTTRPPLVGDAACRQYTRARCDTTRPRSSAMRPVVAVTVSACRVTEYTRARCDTTRPPLVSDAACRRRDCGRLRHHSSAGRLARHRSARPHQSPPRSRHSHSHSVPQCRSHECELGASPPLPHSGPNPTEPNHQKPKNIDSTESNPWDNRTHGPGAGTRGTASPTFFDRGYASPTPTFCTEIRAKVSPLLQLNGYLLKRSVR